MTIHQEITTKLMRAEFAERVSWDRGEGLQIGRYDLRLRPTGFATISGPAPIEVHERVAAVCVHGRDLRWFVQMIFDRDLDTPVKRCGALMREAIKLGLLFRGELQQLIPTAAGADLVK